MSRSFLRRFWAVLEISRSFLRLWVWDLRDFWEIFKSERREFSSFCKLFVKRPSYSLCSFLGPLRPPGAPKVPYFANSAFFRWYFRLIVHFLPSIVKFGPRLIAESQWILRFSTIIANEFATFLLANPRNLGPVAIFADRRFWIFDSDSTIQAQIFINEFLAEKFSGSSRAIWFSRKFSILTIFSHRPVPFFAILIWEYSIFPHIWPKVENWSLGATFWELFENYSEFPGKVDWKNFCILPYPPWLGILAPNSDLSTSRPLFGASLWHNRKCVDYGT